ncbi:MAG: hypothetical protein WBV55_17560 [Candidatus Sulfotelmatobacter sp.]
MKRYIKVVVCLIAMLGTEVVFGQEQSISDSSAASTTSAAVAYVYVSSSSGSSSKVNAYSAASNGKLTPVLGSPFVANVGPMALNSKWLFGTNGIDIYSFSIASDGALNQVSSINAQHFNPYDSGGPGNLFLDHTGASLYDGDTYAYGTGDNAYESFSIDNSTGQLNFLNLTPDGGTEVGSALSFVGNNIYAYSASCYHYTPDIFAYKRNSDQVLSPLTIKAPIPAAPNGGTYCPYLAAADPTDHVAISLTPLTSDMGPDGPPQLATYTVGGSGNLTTTSTPSNMPKTAVTSIQDIWMAPSGKLLAVAGTTGLQVFHFNGASPITHYTGLLTKDEVDQMFWDNDNHLYAISRTAGKLFVFTVTTTSYSQAAGSPYSIANPENIIVLPK